MQKFAFNTTLTPLSGTYTIGGTTPTYATIAAAVADLNARGVSGPVTFAVRAGTYTEQLTLTPVAGASATNRVRFVPESGNAADVVIRYATGNTSSGVVGIQGASYVTLDRLTLQVTTPGGSGTGVLVTGAPVGARVLGCVINGLGSQGNGVYLPSGSPDSLQVDGNTITGGNVGVNVASATLNGVEFTRNVISNSSYGVYASSWQGGSGWRVANNALVNTQVNLQPSGATAPLNVYANSVNMTDGGTAFALGYGTTAGLVRVKDNVFACPGGGQAMTVSYPNVIAESDYNALYTTGATLGTWSGTGYSTLAALRVASGQDAYSISDDPGFLSSTDLHATTPLLDGAGTPLAAVTTDIDGEPRDATHPDIGADEYSVGLVFRLNARPLLRLGLPSSPKPFTFNVTVDGDTIHQMADADGDSVYVAYLTGNHNGTLSYTYSLSFDPGNAQPPVVIREYDNPATRRLATYQQGVLSYLPEVQFGDASVPDRVAGSRAIAAALLYPPANLAGPLGAGANATYLSASNLSQQPALLIGRRFATGLTGAAPVGITTLANGYWVLDAIASSDSVATIVTLDYSALSGIQNPSALRLLTRRPAEPAWTIQPTTTDAYGLSLAANVTVPRATGRLVTMGTVDNSNTLAPAVPPSLPTPTDGLQTANRRPRLSWQPCDGIFTYDLYLWPQSVARPALPFASGLGAANLQVGSTLPFDTEYSWQVIARGSDDLVGPVWSFRTRKAPDLIISQLDVPDLAVSGNQIEFAFKVKNVGPGDSDESGWADRIYLSPVRQPGLPTATPMGQFGNVAILSTDQLYEQKAKFTLPIGLAGTFYVHAIADWYSSLDELSETNNLALDSLIVQPTPSPDLIVTSIVAPLVAVVGDSITVNWTVRNRSTEADAVGPWVDRVLVSRDSFPSGDDAVVYQGTGAAALPETLSYSASARVRLITGLRDTVFLIAQTDAADRVYEFAGESNNFRSRRITLLPLPPADLRVKSVAVDSLVDAGGRLPFSFAVSNIGLNATWVGSWVDAAFLEDSTGTKRVAVSNLLHSGNLSIAPAPDTAYVESGLLSIPVPLRGTYRFVVVTDNGAAVDDLTRSNNRFVGPWVRIVRPLPTDIAMAGIQAVDTVYTGAPLIVDLTVTNRTNSQSPAYQVAVVLSPDSSGNSVGALGGLAGSALANGATQSQRLIAQVPQVSAGAYFIAANCAPIGTDDTLQVNNSALRPIYVKVTPDPDLVPLSIAAPDSMRAGEQYLVRWTVTNVGGARAAGQWIDRLYLLADSTDGRSITRLLATTNQSRSLAMNESYSDSIIVRIPADGYGLRQFQLRAGDSGVPGETNKLNNVGGIYRAIAPMDLPDMRCSRIVAPATSVIGERVTVSWDVSNDGPGLLNGGRWRDVVYLSSGGVGGISLGSVVRSDTVVAGGHYSGQFTFTVPDVGTDGTYYYVVTTNNAASSSEEPVFEGYRYANNNREVATIVARPLPADLVVEAVTAPAIIVPGEPTEISWQLSNHAGTAISGVVRSIVYLSRDSVLSEDDPVAGIVSQNINLPPSVTVLQHAVINAAQLMRVDSAGAYLGPAPGLPVGSAYAIVRTNVSRMIRELDYSNNTARSSTPALVSIEELDIGISKLINAGPVLDRYFRVSVHRPMDLRVSAVGRDAGSTVEVFVNNGTTPSRAVADTAASRISDKAVELTLENAAIGDIYVLVHRAARDTTQMSLEVREIAFGVDRAVPPEVGAGRVTMSIVGGGFSESTVFRLMSASGVVVAVANVKSVARTRARVRWSLDGVVPGRYALSAQSDSNVAVMVDSVVVAYAMLMQVAYSVSVPGLVRNGMSMDYVISIRNTGNVDADHVEALVMTKNSLVPAVVADNGGLASTAAISGALSRAAFELYGIEGEAVDPSSPAEFSELGETVRILPMTAIGLAPGEVVQQRITYRTTRTGSFPFSAWVSVESESERLRDLLNRIEGVRKSVLDSSVGSVGMAADSATFAKAIINIYNKAGLVDEASFANLRQDEEPSRCVATVGADGEARVVRVPAWSAGPLRTEASLLDDAFLCEVARAACKTRCQLRNVLQLGLVYVLCEAACINTGPLFGLCMGVCVLKGRELFRLSEVLDRCLNRCDALNNCTSVWQPADPNEMVGPEGVALARWVRGGDGMAYRVEFENDATLATLAARDIIIRANIDSAVDVRSVRLGNVGFARMVFDDARGRTYSAKRLRVADSVGVDVDMAASIDVVNRQVVWQFRSIDPVTGDTPTDPRGGFLAINDSLGIGRGFCEFQVVAGASETPYPVAESAAIIFDQNDPIDTNVWTNWVDSRCPSSHIADVAPVDSASNGVVLRVVSADSESGIASVRVFASADGAAYVDVGSAIGDSTIVMPTQAGSTYRVYTQATDAAGNREPLKTVPDLTFTTAVQSPSVQANALGSGWQWISSFVAPSDSTTAALNLAFNGRLTLLKDGAGHVYWPTLGIDQIHAWDFRRGYQAYLTAPDTLTLRGRGLVPDTTVINLGAGWNLAAYLRPAAMRADSALTGVVSKLVIAKNSAGQVYWPSLGINTMGTMKPGQAYKMYASQPAALFYPGNVLGYGTASQAEPPVAMPLDLRPASRFRLNATHTGSSATLLVDAPALHDGDEVAVQTADGRSVGAAVVKSGEALVVVWGDDVMTPDTREGPADGDSLTLVSWAAGDDAAQNLSMGTAVNVLTGGGVAGALRYHEDAVYRVGVVSLPLVFSMSQSFPNPFQRTAVIRYGLPRKVAVSLELFDVAGHRVRTLVHGAQEPGYHTSTLSNAGLASGVYFYRLRAGGFTSTRKLVLMP